MLIFIQACSLQFMESWNRAFSLFDISFIYNSRMPEIIYKAKQSNKCVYRIFTKVHCQRHLTGNIIYGRKFSSLIWSFLIHFFVISCECDLFCSLYLFSSSFLFQKIKAIKIRFSYYFFDGIDSLSFLFRKDYWWNPI